MGFGVEERGLGDGIGNEPVGRRVAAAQRDLFIHVRQLSHAAAGQRTGAGPGDTDFVAGVGGVDGCLDGGIGHAQVAGGDRGAIGGEFVRAQVRAVTLGSPIAVDIARDGRRHPDADRL